MYQCLDKTAGDREVTGRVALLVSYNGARYRGWQAQASGVPTVQAQVEKALCRVANHPVEVFCAGRTDACVHASGQVIHFDTTAVRSARSWVMGCNTHLPADVCVHWAGSMSEDFHARYRAFSRRYNYLIYTHPVRPAHFADAITWTHYELNSALMHQAAQYLVGKHDFTSYRAVGCQAKTPVKTVEFVRVNRYDDMIVIDIKADAFLHHMVRNIAGVLMDVGKGKQSCEWVKEVLEAKDRTHGGITAPPFGLYLTEVGFPERFGVPHSEGPPSIIRAMIGREAF